MLRSVQGLLGFRLRASDGEIGRVHDVYFDDHRWVVRYLVVDTHHWLKGRRVLVSPISVLGADWTRGKLNLDLTRTQIEHGPDIDTDRPVARQHEVAFHEYFALPFYWTGGDLWGSAPYPASLRHTTPAKVAAGRAAATAHEGDPHLRSACVVRNHLVRALDGEAGHVEDFLLDDLSWAIRYLVVDTRNWLPGKRVLVPPSRIGWTSWLELAVHVDLTRAALEHAPPYDPSRPVSAEEESRLQVYFERTR